MKTAAGMKDTVSLRDTVSASGPAIVKVAM